MHYSSIYSPVTLIYWGVILICYVSIYRVYSQYGIYNYGHSTAVTSMSLALIAVCSIGIL